jgi:hypothetical protein
VYIDWSTANGWGEVMLKPVGSMKAPGLICVHGSGRTHALLVFKTEFVLSCLESALLRAQMLQAVNDVWMAYLPLLRCSH